MFWEYMLSSTNFPQATGNPTYLCWLFKTALKGSCLKKKLAVALSGDDHGQSSIHKNKLNIYL